MYCKDCGKDIGNGMYCTNCGSGMANVPIQNQQIYGAQIHNPQMHNMQFYGPKRKVNKIAFGMLALFGGMMGLHRFYSGKNRSGVAYILLFWTLVPSLLSFAEGIIALTKEDNGDCLIEVDPDKFFI